MISLTSHEYLGFLLVFPGGGIQGPLVGLLLLDRAVAALRRMFEPDLSAADFAFISAFTLCKNINQKPDTLKTVKMQLDVGSEPYLSQQYGDSHEIDKFGHFLIYSLLFYRD